MNNKYNMGITPFEGFLLSHNYTSHYIQDSINFYVRLSFPSDQTMFNGWRTPSSLSTIITRVFDVACSDFTEYVLNDYSYWANIDNGIVEKYLKNLESYAIDAEKFRNLIVSTEFLEGDTANKKSIDRQLFIDKLTEAALILRKYMKEVDDALVLI